MKSTHLILIPTLIAASCIRAQEADVSTLIAKGDTLDHELRSEEALDVYLEASKLRPDDAEILARISKQLSDSVVDISDRPEQIERAKKAKSYAEKAVKADGNSAKAHLALAVCCGKLAYYEEPAERIALSRKVKIETERAIELDPKNDLAYHLLGRWHYEVANLNSVLLTLVKAIYGGLPKASNEEALACFKKAIALAPNRVIHHIELGRTYAIMGKKDLARAALEKGLSLPVVDKEDAEEKMHGREALARL